MTRVLVEISRGAAAMSFCGHRQPTCDKKGEEEPE